MKNLLSLVPAVHLLPLVKGRNNKSSRKLPFYMACLIVYADHTIICFLCNHFSSVLPEGSQTNRQNGSSIETIRPFCINETETKRNNNVILSHTVCWIETANQNLPLAQLISSVEQLTPSSTTLFDCKQNCYFHHSSAGPQLIHFAPCLIS